MKALFFSMLALLTLATWMHVSSPNTVVTRETPVHSSDDGTPPPIKK